MGTLKLGTVHIDLERREIRSPDGSTSSLTPNEHQLLTILAAHPNQTVPRDTLLSQALGYRTGLSTRALSNAVLRLRHKIEVDPAEPVHLKTVYGVGYRLELPTTHAPPPETAEAIDAPAGALLGRWGDQERLRVALDTGRLVTLVGPAGVGKTTLAQHVAGGLFVDLAEEVSAEGVARAIAAALGISLRRGQVQRSLRARGSILVVLDNAEQLGDDAVAWLGRLHAETTARLLVTSRRPLGLGEEQTVALAPLSVDDGVTLFRAQAPWLAAEDGQLSPLVARLDGLPLAIVLAAARCRLLTPEQLLVRLDARRDMLRSRRPDLPVRRVSMWAALENSWELLSDEEASVLVACARFAGTLSADGVEALCPESDPLLDLEALRRLSLLEDAGPGTLRMLLTVRDFVRARTPDARAAALDAQLAAWVLEQAEGHARGLHRGQWAAGIAGLRRLAPELRAIWAARSQRPGDAARAALALDALWVQQASEAEHRALLESACALPGLGPELATRLAVAWALLAIEAGEPAAVLPRLASLPNSIRKTTRLAAVRLRCVALMCAGQLGEARAGLDGALAEAAATGERWHEAMLRTTLSRLQFAAGDLDGAERSTMQALPLLRQTGHRFGEANLHERRGRILDARGDLAGALESYAQERAIWATMGIHANLASSLISAASVWLHRLGADGAPLPTFDPGAADRALAQARPLVRREGREGLERFVVVNQLRAALFLGALDAAEEHYQDLRSLLMLEPHPGLLDGLSLLLGGIVSGRRGDGAQSASRIRQGMLLAGDDARLRAALAGHRPGGGLSVAERVLFEQKAP